MQQIYNKLLPAVLLVIAGCAADTMAASSDVIYHVNSFRVPCVGVAPMSCLQVKRGDTANGEWRNFYSSILGFEYQPGYLYRLLVRETQLPPDQVPADASSIRFELVELIERAPDPRLALQDIWVVELIGGANRDAFDLASDAAQPYLEFNVPRSEYLGSDGCNSIRGTLQFPDGQELRLGQATSVDVASACASGAFQSKLRNALNRIAYWRRDGLWLTLLDAEENELLVLRKTD